MIRTNLRVGPAGSSTAKIADFMELIDSCQAQGFSALELEFVRVTSTEYPSSDTMKQLAGYAKKRGVGLSIHGSFYINLAAIEEKKITLAKEFLKQGIRVAEAASANLIFHPGYFQNLSHEDAIAKAIKLLNRLEISNPSMLFLETPGKLNAIGDVSEMLEIAAQTGVQIGIDFAHIFARSHGKIREKGDIFNLLSMIEQTISQNYFHMHISGIEFTKKGEKRHIPFYNSEFPVEIVTQALQEVDYRGTLICESPKRWKGDTELLLQLFRGDRVQIARKKRITLHDFLK